MNLNIARIISKNKNIETIECVDITDDYTSIDYDIPTLIVGKEFAEEIFGKDKIKIIDKRIEKNVFWCFGKFERRDEYEKSLREFNDYVIKEIFKSVEYRFFSIFTRDLYDKKKLIIFLNNRYDKYIYIFEDHIYINFNEKVLGLSLKEFEYVGIKKEKIIRKMYENKNNHIITNDYFLPKKLKELIGNNRIVIPYLFKRFSQKTIM